MVAIAISVVKIAILVISMVAIAWRHATAKPGLLLGKLRISILFRVLTSFLADFFALDFLVCIEVNDRCDHMKR